MHNYRMQNTTFADIFQFRLFGDCLISTGTAVIMIVAARPRREESCYILIFANISA